MSYKTHAMAIKRYHATIGFVVVVVVFCRLEHLSMCVCFRQQKERESRGERKRKLQIRLERFHFNYVIKLKMSTHKILYSTEPIEFRFSNRKGNADITENWPLQ